MLRLTVSVFLVSQTIEAKLDQGKVRLAGVRRPNAWQFVTKFGWGVGTGTYEIRARLKKPRAIGQAGWVTLELYSDEVWTQAEGASDPCKRKDLATKIQSLPVPNNGTWGDWVNGNITHEIVPHIWYFAFSECNNSMPSSTHTLSYEFHAKQNDGSEFSIELRHMLLVHALHLVGCAYFLRHYYHLSIRYVSSAGALHPVIASLSWALGLQCVAYLFHTTHLLFYAYNGSGIWVLDMLAEILLVVNQAVISGLLVLIAFGYTLLHSVLDELEIVIPLTFIVTMGQALLVAVGKFSDGAAYKYHEHEGIIGWILLTIRLVFALVFHQGARTTAANARGLTMAAFLCNFRFAGLTYFMAYPLILILTKLFPPYWQHSVFATGYMTMQMCCNVWLASIFLKRGEYFKVSTLNCSFLPGASNPTKNRD